MPPVIRIVVLFCATISPLLTLSALWQLKEWRIDRLKEHLKRTGIYTTLFGTLRPTIISIGIVSVLIAPSQQERIGDIVLGILALLSATQIASQRQKLPNRTAKATILICLGCVFNMGIGIGVATIPWANIIIVILQPIVLLCAWMLFLPLDTLAKQYIMRKAKQLLQTYTSTTVIGITGSVGKTTTKELIAHVLQSKNMMYSPAYINSEMGISKWLLQTLPKKKRDEDIILIIEMGAYGTGEIRKLCTIAPPNIGIVTYIGKQHIALFGSQEALQKAKGELIEALPSTGVALINGDCDLCIALQNLSPCPIKTVGTGGHVDKKACDIEETGKGITFKVDSIEYTIPIHGTHNVTNALLAIAACEEIGMTQEEIAARLQTYTQLSNTFSVRQEYGITILDDTHNASPESFHAGLEWVKSQPAAQKVLITPGLIELGDETKRIHGDLGTQASQSGIQRVIFTQNTGFEAFKEQYHGSLERYNPQTTPLQPGDVLLCIGRIPETVIRSLLPETPTHE